MNTVVVYIVSTCASINISTPKDLFMSINKVDPICRVKRHFTFLLSSLLPVSSLQVAITPGANPTAGQSYTFTCTVGGLTGTPTVQWVGPGSSAPITSNGDFTVSSTPPYTLTINPLRQSYDGQYTCQATIGSTTGSTSTTLTVQGD